MQNRLWSKEYLVFRHLLADCMQSKEDMIQPTSEGKALTGKLVAATRTIYRPLGFSKGYNFLLFVIFAGAMLGFLLALFSYLNVENGIITAKATIEYVILLLALIANAGALIIARRAFGGGLDVQFIVGVLTILTTTSLAFAYYNIKRLQTDQHRAWKLRAWFHFGSITITRFFMITSSIVITKIGSYYQVRTCGEMAFVFGGDWDNPQSLPPLRLKMYPQCINGTQNTPVLVNANFNGSKEEIGAALGLSFGMALWLAFIVHALGLEWYLWLTPAKSSRLTNVSYERQLEGPFRNAGNAGLTVDR